MDFLKEKFLENISFKTSRSGGKGGQNVNKVSSKVELNFDFESSPNLKDEQKIMLRTKLSKRLTADGQIQVVSEEERSQLLNKERALEKLWQLLQTALTVQKARKATRPRKSAVEQRLKEKQQQALKKMNRKKDW
ncbi:alternative ribosome rescue aminoacyl-tRNA hydrolase ArfB [Pedobacter sp. SYSU D00535]|uniref:alternative ribosome rescue aminoacyl-tRNA hydrolase ArfB n=1 Tax=Pedobacter sp. SYSU D00535 TaxID=2810308 RepID=UPI001A9709FB|nr:alternative ribosome rescue aminoacyl-tRNA hydrolase ArfB [Pedobacter sp. SYSU D00535]